MIHVEAVINKPSLAAVTELNTFVGTVGEAIHPGNKAAKQRMLALKSRVVRCHQDLLEEDSSSTLGAALKKLIAAPTAENLSSVSPMCYQADSLYTEPELVAKLRVAMALG